MTIDRPRDDTASRPLATVIDATENAVRTGHDGDDPITGYKAIARLSGHLAAMWHTVYPRADRQPGENGQLRAACLRYAREVEWALRLLQCHRAGEASAIGWPTAAVLTLLAQRLDEYRSAERALVAWLEDQLTPEGREELAGKYRRALTARPPARTRAACAPGRWPGWRSGCTAAGTGSSTRWTAAPAWAATSRRPDLEIQVSRRKRGEYHKRDHCRRVGLGKRGASACISPRLPERATRPA